MSVKWYVQEALYNALTSSSTFTTIVSNKIFDEPPTNTTYPYVVIGNATEVPECTHDKKGYNVTMTNFIYTKPYGLGFYQGDMILKAMNDVLHMKRFTMTGYNMIICKLDNTVWSREDDKRIIDVRYRLHIQES
jgi:hypothetical protein